MIFKKYVFVLLAIKLLTISVFAKEAKEYSTPKEYLEYKLGKNEDLFWEIIQDYCPDWQINCYYLKKEIEKKLKELKEKLAKKPEFSAYRDPDIPEEICKMMDEELKRSNIDPGKVSLRVETLEEDTVAGTSFPNFHARITFNKRFFLTSNDSENEKNYKEAMIKNAVRHEPGHVRRLDPVRGWYIQMAKSMGENQVAYSESEKRVFIEKEKKFKRQKEFIAEIMPALEDPKIAYLREYQECACVEKPYNRITKKNKYKNSGIHRSTANICYVLKKVHAMYEKENDA